MTTKQDFAIVLQWFINIHIVKIYHVYQQDLENIYP